MNLDSIVAYAQQRHAVPLGHREPLSVSLAEQQKRWGGDPSIVKKFAEGAVAVVTGQQPGLFTGPLYAILKAITTIKLARYLDEAGVPAVPIFWIAAEDHDYEEIQSTEVLDRDFALKKIAVDLANTDSAPSGWLRFKKTMSGMPSCRLSFRAATQSEFQGELQNLLESAYRPESSPVDAFGRMMTRLFAGSGLIFADPLDPEMKRISTPLLHEVVQRNVEIRSAIMNRDKTLSEAGYHEQVRVDGNFTGLFAGSGAARRQKVLRPEELTGNSAVELVIESQRFDPSDQFRTLIFPNVAYVAGPAEIAYLAQAGGGI